MQRGLRALPLVFMMATGSTHVFGQQLTCYAIRRGDTAAGLAQRLTGYASNRHQPWFQIVDPTTSTYVAKSRYGVIQSGWHVCVPPGTLNHWSALPVLSQTSLRQEEVPIDASALLWAAPAFTVVSVLGLIWARKLAGRRRASLGVMRRFGARFISEFERPLFRSAVDSPVKSRLRFAPARQRLEILLAPADGRTYPNLADHRRNVESTFSACCGF